MASKKKTWQGRVVAKMIADNLKMVLEVDGDAIDSEDRVLVSVCNIMQLHPKDVMVLKAEILKESKRQAKFADLPERWIDVRQNLES